MLLRICCAAIVASFVLAGSAQAQVRSLMKLPDPRDEFVRMCAPHMLGRWAHPEEVCGCLHDHAAAAVEDDDLREALLRGISETGVPTIETDWVPRDRRDVYEDRKADAAMHVPAREIASHSPSSSFGR